MKPSPADDVLLVVEGEGLPGFCLNKPSRCVTPSFKPGRAVLATGRSRAEGIPAAGIRIICSAVSCFRGKSDGGVDRCTVKLAGRKEEPGGGTVGVLDSLLSSLLLSDLFAVPVDISIRLFSVD